MRRPRIPYSKELSPRFFYLGLFYEDKMTFTERLAQELGSSRSEVESFLYSAPERYKVYRIPKRKHGFRVIAQPSKELKEYQRQFESLLPLPVHDSATAYRRGKSIKDNALAHRKHSYLLKLDLENFFNSITPSLFWNVCSKAGNLPFKTDQIWIEKLLFWKLKGRLVLSVGAPTSPLVSNFCMFYFDEALAKYCKGERISYTRYADDLTFSTNSKDILFSLPSKVEHLLQEHFSGDFSINQSKTAFSSKAHNRHVTGITITNNGTLSLGRERKRYIKHKVHQFKLKKLDDDEIKHLQGLLSFAKHVEPLFLDSLSEKYSNSVMKEIFEAKNEQRS